MMSASDHLEIHVDVSLIMYTLTAVLQSEVEREPRKLSLKQAAVNA